MSVKVEAADGREVKISAVGKVREALREVNLASDSICGAWRSLAHL